MAELEPLIRVQKHRVDERQKRLARLFRQQEEWESKKESLLKQIETEANAIQDMGSNTDIEVQKAFILFRANAHERIKKIDSEIDNLETRIEIARDKVREAFSEMKQTETVDNNRKEREAEATKKKDAQTMDEIGVSGFLRKKKEES